MPTPPHRLRKRRAHAAHIRIRDGFASNARTDKHSSSTQPAQEIGRQRGRRGRDGRTGRPRLAPDPPSRRQRRRRRPGGKRGAAGRPGGDVPSTVGVATAEKADVPVVLDALGTVTAAATTTVRAQVSGILQKVLFTEGQMVKAGQVLAQIDPRQFEMALLQATGQRQRDEAQLDIAKLTLTRYQTLLKQDSIALQDVDTQAALVKQLDGTVKTDVAAEGAARL